MKSTQRKFALEWNHCCLRPKPSNAGSPQGLTKKQNDKRTVGERNEGANFIDLVSSYTPQRGLFIHARRPFLGPKCPYNYYTFGNIPSRHGLAHHLESPPALVSTDLGEPTSLASCRPLDQPSGPLVAEAVGHTRVADSSSGETCNND